MDTLIGICLFFGWKRMKVVFETFNVNLLASNELFNFSSFSLRVFCRETKSLFDEDI